MANISNATDSIYVSYGVISIIALFLGFMDIPGSVFFC